MKKIWPYIAIFFVGAFAAMTMVFFTQKPQTVINAETYIDEQNQKIGKIKQKGKSNEQDVEVVQELTGKESRKAKRESRKTERLLKFSSSIEEEGTNEVGEVVK